MTPAEFKQAAATELRSILHYWQQTIDDANGGFIGQVDYEEKKNINSPKGSVLNARILWSFSAACQLGEEKDYLRLAKRAFDYFLQYFIDKEFGGVFWSIDHLGKPLETKKQIYAQAFALYAFAEYYKITKDEKAKQLAIELFELIEKYSFDAFHDGYFEAFTRGWNSIDDLRLSEKDANEKKTMNTHLHILEAYSNLYSVWPDSFLQTKIKHLLGVFNDRIIDAQSSHLNLFFDEQWKVKGADISYGHDIEASWLLQEAAESIRDEEMIDKFKKQALRIADASFEGLDKDGGLWYEYKRDEKLLVKEKHWWPQAEAVVGFVNAWQVSGDKRYYKAAIDSWSFIQKYIVDKNHGEWYWGVKEDYTTMKEDKVGVWKCPYHNSRACVEVMRRL